MQMNQMPWYQELRDKRMGYGVSQNKLAVHVGITRRYVSEIETGKVTHSDTMQATLFDVLKQCNAVASLEMWIDYVRIRFITNYSITSVEDIIPLAMVCQF